MQSLRRHGAICEPLESRMLLSTVTVTAPWDRVDGDVSSIDALVANPGLDQEITLREAIQAANNTEGEDEIKFWKYLKGLSLQVLSDLEVTDTVTIIGHGEDDMFLSADGIHAFFNIDMTDTPGGTFTLNDITLQGEAEYAVLAHPGEIVLNDVTVRLEGEPEDDTYASSGNSYSLLTIVDTSLDWNTSENSTQHEPPVTSSTTIQADKITIGNLTGIDMQMAIQATGHVQIDSITNQGNDLTIEGDSITATGKISTTPSYDSEYRDAGDITFTSHNGPITVHQVTADAGGARGGSRLTLSQEMIFGYIGPNGPEFTIDDLILSHIFTVEDTGLLASNGGDITFQTTNPSWDGPLVYIEGDGLISADGQYVFMGSGGLSGTITIEHEVASQGNATLTVSSQAGDNYQGVVAGGIWDNVDDNAENLRELVEQYGGIIIGQFVMKPGELKLNEQVLQDGFGDSTQIGGTLTFGGTSGFVISAGNDWWRPTSTHDHNVTGNITIDEQGRLVYTFSPSQLEGSSYTYQILTQPDEGTISFVDGQFVFYPMERFDFSTQEISFRYRIIFDNGRTSNRSTVTMTMQNINTFEPYNTNAPMAAPNRVRTDSQTAIDIDVLSNDHDPDGDPFFITSVDAVSQLGVSLSINDDGTIAYAPAQALSDLQIDEQVRDVFYYTVSDLFGNTDTVRVFVDVTGAQTPDVNVATSFSSRQLLAMAMHQPRRVNESTPTLSQMSNISKVTSTASTLAQHFGLINMDWSRYGMSGWTPLTVYHSDSSYELTRWFVSQFDDETPMATIRAGDTFIAFPTNGNAQSGSTKTVGFFRNLLTGRTPIQSGSGTIDVNMNMSGGLTISQASATLSGDNTYTGSVDINSGTLEVIDGEISGGDLIKIGNGTLTIAGDTTGTTVLTMNTAVTGELTISGTGTLEKIGPVAVTLSVVHVD